MRKDRIDVLVERANDGDVSAMGKLAECFFKGHLVEKSLENAWYWSYKAATAGDSLGKKIYEELKLYMSHL